MTNYEKLLLKRKVIMQFLTAFLLCISMILLMTFFIFLARNNENKDIGNSNVVEYHDSLNFLLITDNTSLEITSQYALARLNFKENKVYFTNIPPETKLVYESKENTLEGIFNLEAGDIHAKSALEENFNFAIDYTIVGYLSTTSKLVDELSGLAVDMPETIKDSNGFTIEKGIQTMDGNKVVELLKYQLWSGGKSDEIAMQATIMENMINQYFVPSTYNDLESIYKKFVNKIETDFSYTEFVSIIQPLQPLFTEQNPARKLEFTGDYVKEGEAYKFIPDENSKKVITDYFS